MKPLFSHRLIIRPLKLTDAKFIFQLLNQPSWIEFIGDKKIHSIDDAKNYLRTSIFQMYEKHSVGLNLVKLKSTDESIGLCGLINRDTLDDIDLGYAFLPEYWGQGYVQEAAQATLDYGKNLLHLKRIVAITLENNPRCINLLLKLGFKLEHEKIMDQDEQLQLYAIDLN